MEKKKAAVPLICHGHSRPVVDLFYSPVTPDGYFLISASKDSNPMLRNGETGDWIGTFEGHKGAVWSCCLDTNALRAASGSADFSAKVWDALTGDELHSFEHKHIVRACAFSKDTNLLLTGGMEKILRVYDLNRPDAAPKELAKSPASVRTVAWLHNDQTILSSCTDTGGVRLWDVRSEKIVQTLETKAPVTSAEVSQDGRFITTADGSSVKFWDANHFGLVKSYDMSFTVESASLEPKSGSKFIAGGEDMWVHVFDYFTGEEISCNKGHHGPVHCVRFAPGGEERSIHTPHNFWKKNREPPEVKTGIHNPHKFVKPDTGPPGPNWSGLRRWFCNVATRALTPTATSLQDFSSSMAMEPHLLFPTAGGLLEPRPYVYELRRDFLYRQANGIEPRRP